jgi:hypothetical protein
MRNFILAAAAACLLGAAPAQAQDYYYRDSPWDSWGYRETGARYIDCDALDNVPSFYRMDINDDGRIARWEFARMGLSLNNFRQLDLNGSGTVSRGELSSYHRRCD